MTTLEIKSKKREIFGKKLKVLRNQGLVPAVVYGGKVGNVPLILELKNFKKVFKSAGQTTLVRLFIDGEKFPAKGGSASGGKDVLIHDIMRDSVTDEIKHIDFYEVKMDEKIIAKIPLVFIGDSPAVTDLDGILVKAMQEIQIKALPSALPHQIEVNISSLKAFSDTILIKDIKLPENVEVLESPSASIVSIVPPRSEAELEALAGKVEEKVEEVAVETEEKAAERVKEAVEEEK